MGTHSTADTVGLTALGVVAAGVGGHAVASALEANVNATNNS